MKKNKMMRAASGLLVATLLTTSIISGTFAKYVTTANGSDNARVAKWGITMDNGTAMFSDTYDSGKVVGKDDANKGKLVVAPGTHGSTTYSVSGAPETSYKITFASSNIKDVLVPKNATYSYKDTEANVSYTAPTGATAVTVADDYYPVNYEVTVTAEKAIFGKASGDKVAIDTSATAQKFETLQAALAALDNTVLTYDANEEAAVTVTIKWAWQFDDKDTSGENYIEVENHKANDALDTVLGDVIANNSDLTASNNITTDIAYTLTMTATQID